MGDVGSGGGCARAGAKDIWGFSVPIPQLCAVPKTALKKKKSLDVENRKQEELLLLVETPLG